MCTMILFSFPLVDEVVNNEFARLSEKLFLMHLFVWTKVDDVNTTKVKSHEENQRDKSFILGPPLYK